MGSRRGRAALAVLLALSGCAAPHARLADFEAALAASDSATAALEQWCARRGLAHPARVTALPVISGERAAPPDARVLLAVDNDEPLAHRHVRLACGERALSDAQNWYVPARLTADMNASLAATDTPFGKVAAPLRFRRERVESRRGALPDCPADTILSHRARLVLPDGRPLALVVECYTPANLQPARR